MLNAETLPLLDTLQQNVQDLVDLQKRVMEIGAEEAKQSYGSARNMMLMLGAGAAVVGMLFAFFLTRSVVKQLGGEPEYVADIARRVAVGDLAIGVETRMHDKSSVLFAMKTMVEKLSQVVNEVNSSASALAAASEQVSATAQSLSQASSEQAAGVEETERLDRADDGLDRAEHRERQGHRRHGDQGGAGSQRGRRGGQGDGGGDEADRARRSASSTTSPTRPICWP